MSSQTINTKRWFSKEWLLEQKSLIALLVLIAVVSSLSPNFLPLITCLTFSSRLPSTPLWPLG